MIRTALPRLSFDGDALVAELDETRSHLGLRWTGLADQLWRQSDALNAELGDDAVCPGALQRTVKRGTMTCQYALMLLRWLGRAPEDFLVGPVADVGPTALPPAGRDRRLRFDLHELFVEVDARRTELGLTWATLGAELDCTPARLTNLKSAKQADMDLVMRVTQWLRRPAARYVHAAAW